MVLGLVGTVQLCVDWRLERMNEEKGLGDRGEGILQYLNIDRLVRIKEWIENRLVVYLISDHVRSLKWLVGLL